MSQSILNLIVGGLVGQCRLPSGAGISWSLPYGRGSATNGRDSTESAVSLQMLESDSIALGLAEGQNHPNGVDEGKEFRMSNKECRRKKETKSLLNCNWKQRGETKGSAVAVANVRS